LPYDDPTPPALDADWHAIGTTLRNGWMRNMVQRGRGESGFPIGPWSLRLLPFLGRRKPTRRRDSTSSFRWMPDFARPRCVTGSFVQSNRSGEGRQIDDPSCSERTDDSGQVKKPQSSTGTLWTITDPGRTTSPIFGDNRHNMG